MVEQLLNHIQRHNLCKTTDKILLAVSGGLDSMVLLHLMHGAGFSVAVAHCNFQLRGEDSEADEVFVREVCDRLAIPVHSTRFDTAAYADDNGISIQMAARELRYRFFDTLAAGYRYDLIATAHHLNDVLETIVLNLARGSGMDGIAGIPAKNNTVIRPLLFASRSAIEQYARANGLVWREDKSNLTDDYARNFVRHQIIPRLREVNPRLEETFRNTSERLQGSRQLLKSFIDQFRHDAVTITGATMSVNKKKLAAQGVPAVLLWELIKDKGFNFMQCREIVEDVQSGKKILSSTYELTVDRDHYLIATKTAVGMEPVYIGWPVTQVKNQRGVLQFAASEKEGFTLQKDPAIAQLDLQKLTFPIVWRTWKHGDAFVPLGMRQSKKLSDFLIDAKISLPEKDRVTVLESAGTIAWVVGLRINDHFKVTDDTLHVLRISFHPEKG